MITHVALAAPPAQAMLAQGDPSGMSTPLGKIVIALGLVAVIVVLLRALWHQRGR